MPSISAHIRHDRDGWYRGASQRGRGDAAQLFEVGGADQSRHHALHRTWIVQADVQGVEAGLLEEGRQTGRVYRGVRDDRNRLIHESMTPNLASMSLHPK